MTQNGTKYKAPCVLIVGKTEDEDLIFGNVTSIFIHNQSLLFFEVEILNSKFCPHYHAYAISMPPSFVQQLIKHSDLTCYHPYGLYYCPHLSSEISLRYVVLRSNVYP